jgi:alginate O-acetyltransferase complex protein AlgI
MLFNSAAFLFFLLITFVIYYLPFIQKFQVLVLVSASFIFYAYTKPLLLLLLVLSVGLNAIFSYSIFVFPAAKARIILSVGVVFNIAVICFFKYSPLFASLFVREFGSNSVLNFLLTIPLPIGISFYTFEGISLLVDLHNGKAKFNSDERQFSQHLKRAALFISFFPHLIAGPILKAREFYPQIATKFFREIPWEQVIKKLILGYFLKMVVADNLKDITYAISYPYFQQYSSGNLLLLLFGYSIQIFADFAGYSLIAIGLGLLFGYNLPDNFNFPYISSSFSEFWRRWHISLSTWLRDYLYIPLGGNRKGKIRTYFNIFIVMLLGGFWHGAAWSYAVWGALHGIALMVERAIRKNDRKREKKSIPGMITVFVVVTLFWLLFKLTNFYDVMQFLRSLTANLRIPFEFNITELSILFYSLPVIIYHLVYLMGERGSIGRNWVSKIEIPVYGLMFFFIINSSGSQGEFIYFQF